MLAYLIEGARLLTHRYTHTQIVSHNNLSVQLFQITYNVLLSDWFLMTPSIATKFQYVNSPFYFLFSLTTCFGPYGPSSGEIYN
jgi:hypothetical protein